MNKCKDNSFKDKVCILIPKDSTNEVIKIKGIVVPKGIDTKKYTPYFVDAKSVEHLPFFGK